MTRSQSLGEEEMGLLGWREEEGRRRNEQALWTERREQSRQDVGRGMLDLLVESRFLTE